MEKIKFNDYVYGFNTGDIFKVFQVSLRIRFINKVEASEIFKMILQDASSKSGVDISKINITFISVVYQGEED